MLVHPLDRLGAGALAIGLARIDDDPDDRSTRQADQAVGAVGFALVSVLVVRSRRPFRLLSNSGVAWANVLSRKGSNATRPLRPVDRSLYL